MPKPDGERPLEQTVPCTVICAGGCGTTFLGKAQADRVVENEVVHMGWLDGLTMVRIFVSKVCGANPSGTEAILYISQGLSKFSSG
jgi:hypothetical protein